MAQGKKGGKDGKDRDSKKDGGRKSDGNPGAPNESDEVATAQGQADLRDATADEKEAWGQINDRDVSRSLRELWDKIPPAYRLSVIEYFKDITDEEDEQASK